MNLNTDLFPLEVLNSVELVVLHWFSKNFIQSEMSYELSNHRSRKQSLGYLQLVEYALQLYQPHYYIPWSHAV